MAGSWNMIVTYWFISNWISSKLLTLDGLKVALDRNIKNILLEISNTKAIPFFYFFSKYCNDKYLNIFTSHLMV